MIARIWHGVVPAAKAGEYLRYLERTGLADYKNTPGNRGVQVLQRTEDGKTHFTLITLWDDYDAVRAFAGDDYEKAHYYDKDTEFLLELEPTVTHHEWKAY